MKQATIQGATALIVAFAAATSALAHQGEHTKLSPFDGAAEDRFGAAVDIDERLAIVGAPGDDDAGLNAGSVYVYARTNSLFGFEAKLMPARGIGGERFGTALDLDGDTLVIGAPDNEPGSLEAGSVFVFVRTGTSWMQEARLMPSDGSALDAFGRSVSLSGDTVMIGAPANDVGTASGKVYVFTRSRGIWTEEASFAARDANAGDGFGASVSLDGDRALIGAPRDSDIAFQAGSAYVYSRTGSAWSMDEKLIDPAGSAGDLFGISVSLEDARNQLAIGSPMDDDVATDSGAVLVYRLVAGAWTLIAKINEPGQGAGDQSGGAVRILDRFVASGALFDDEEALNAGKVWLFIDDGTSFHEEVLVASDATQGLFLGASFGLGGCWGIGGAPGEAAQGTHTGAAYVYDLAFPPVTYCTAGTSASGCVGTISALGHPSANDTSGFLLVATDLESGKDGLFFFGTNGRQANPWGNSTSFQCVVPPVVRGSLLTGTGTPGLCDNNLAQDMNALWCPSCPKAAKSPGVGALVQAQFWYRDPDSTSNQTTALTGAIEFEICP
jgi:hypothetical protein